MGNRSSENYIQKQPAAYAFHKVVYDSLGHPIDYIFLHVDKTFEQFTGLKAKNIIGKKVTEVLSGLTTESFDWIEEYGKIADGKTHVQFEAHQEALGRYYSVIASSCEPGYFTTLFFDISSSVKKVREHLFVYDKVYDYILELDDNFQILYAESTKTSSSSQDILASYKNKKLIEIIPEKFHKEIFDLLNGIRESEKAGTYIYSTSDNSSEKYFEMDIIYLSSSKYSKFLVYARDITLKYKLERRLSESESLFRTLFEKAQVGIYIEDANGTMANNEYKRMIGLEGSDKSVDKYLWQQVTAKDDLEKEMLLFDKFKKGEIDGYEFFKRIIRKDGSTIWVNLVATRLDIEKSGFAYVCLLHDVTSIVESTTALKESKRSREMLLNHIPGTAYKCLYNPEWTMLDISDACLELTGYSHKEFVSNSITYQQIIAPEYKDKVWEEWKWAVENKSIFRMEYEIIAKDNTRKWVYEQGQCIFDEQDGNPSILEGLIMDITESKLRELDIEYLNKHDRFTGLYNRIHFMNELERLNKQEHLPIAIVIGDINGVRLINNAFGTRVGDRLILRYAKLIERHCRGKDIAARISGDSFAIIMPQTDSKTAYDIVHNIRKEVEELSKFGTSAPLLAEMSLAYEVKTSMDEDINLVYRSAEDLLYQRKLLERTSTHNDIINAIKSTLYSKSEETEEHAARMYTLGEKIAKEMDLPQRDLDKLHLLCLLHDVGKIGIEDSILKKPGPLAKEEWVKMKMHPEIGYKIAISTSILEPIADFILTHHEHYDGSGYPKGLSKEDIPLLSRILAVADTYDSITNNRVYRKAQSVQAAIEEINKYSGSQFDPLVVNAFNKIMNSHGYIKET